METKGRPAQQRRIRGKGGHDGKINSFLFHIIFTKSRDENKDICREIYAFEEEIHNSDKCEIYCCLHKNLDPLIMEYILETQFPGVMNSSPFHSIDGFR